jgi:hypothetical protein
MPDRDEIVQSLTGAWRLFLDRPDAMRYFNVSIDGFWRSFAAIVLILPAYALFAIAERIEILGEPVVDPAFSDGPFIVNKFLTLALDWITLPILLAAFARLLGVSRTYAAYVVARNWCAVLATAPFGLVALLSLVGFLGAGLANVISLVILVVVIRYNYMIVRRALGADMGLAIGVVVADFAVSLLIIGAVDEVVTYHSAGL